jgi:hypothetical protein
VAEKVKFQKDVVVSSSLLMTIHNEHPAERSFQEESYEINDSRQIEESSQNAKGKGTKETLHVP